MSTLGDPASFGQNVELYSIGEILVDMIFKSEVKEGGSVEIHFGGAPANVAVGVARLGHRAGFIGAVGSDSFGDFLVKTLRENNVDASLVSVKKARTTLAIVTVDPSGERRFFFYRKPWTETADTMLTPNDVDFERIRWAKCVHFSGFSTSYSPTSNTVFEVVDFAYRNGFKVSFDPTFREDIWLSREDAVSAYEKSLRYSHVVSMSIDEVEALYGTRNYKHVVDHILSRHPSVEVVAIRLGSKGAYAKTRDGRETYKEAFKVRVVDTTGAGDAWTAAFLSSFVLEEMSLEESVVFANAVAGIVCTQYGAISSFPSRSEVTKFLRERQKFTI